MAIIKCKMCGGDLNLVEGQSVAECEYCGSRQTVPAADNEKKLTLFARAGRLRAACEFDKAAGIYEAIVADFPEEAEAYWGLVLCKYGIEYVDDPATGKKIPTCHRSSYDSVMDDGNFEQAMENADEVALRVYREEAKRIEEVRKGILAVSSNEQPYDIFICYKETDTNGDRTVDSLLAQDIYDALTGRGYRVFFSRITLEDKLGQAYEPYIFAALNSAKIMLAIGTCYEHYNAVWVKNEWSRYLKIIAQDKNKYLIPCYKGIDAYDIPKEFAHLQGQDMGKVGAIQDLLRGVEKLLPRQAEAPRETVVVQQAAAAAPGVESLLKRVFIFLEDENWAAANEYCEKVLDIDPENGEAYLGKLMAELKLHKKEQLPQQTTPIWNRKNYQKAMTYGNETLRALLEDSKQAFLARWYAEAETAQAAATDSAALRKAAELFARLGDYRDGAKRAEECRVAAGNYDAEQRRLKEEREAAEREARAQYQKKIGLATNLFAASSTNTSAIRLDGTVMVAGKTNNAVLSWTDIVAISASRGHTVGLMSDGSVVAVGANNDGQCDVSGWRNIVAISAGCFHTVGLKSDGTVVAEGYNEKGQCNVSGWRDIIAISAGGFHTVGLKSDGTVVAVGCNDDGQCYASGWRDIVAVSAGVYHSIGLKVDGTVVAVGYIVDGRCNVSGWRDIVAISAGGFHTVGLKADGTVVAEGYNEKGQCNVSGWDNIVAISAGDHHTVGLKANGTMVATKINDKWSSFDKGQCDVFRWRLFKNFYNIEEELAQAAARREERRKQQLAWQQAGLCRHCGGQLKGLFVTKCVSCGKSKDY